jgi:DNA-binding GntR family transcriptional regulator
MRGESACVPAAKDITERRLWARDLALTTQRRASEDWKEHSQILVAAVEGNEEQAATLAAEHVHAAAQATLAAKKTLVAKSS